MTILAITGGTGFVGKRAIDLALAAGHTVRALTRRPQPPRDGVTWIEGALDTLAALLALATGADAVIHIAGVTSAPDEAGFVAGNVAGTQAMVDATIAAGVTRFVHVSSLAAREPNLSTLWLHRKSHVRKRSLPPAGLDASHCATAHRSTGRATWRCCDLFRMAKTGVSLLLPPGGRASIGDPCR